MSTNPKLAIHYIRLYTAIKILVPINHFKGPIWDFDSAKNRTSGSISIAFSHCVADAIAPTAAFCTLGALCTGVTPQSCSAMGHAAATPQAVKAAETAVGDSPDKRATCKAFCQWTWCTSIRNGKLVVEFQPILKHMPPLQLEDLLQG